MTSSPERTQKKTPTVALAIACLSVAIATVVNTCHIAYSIHVTICTVVLTAEVRLHTSRISPLSYEKYGIK
jgi:hypothetical protein